MGLIEFLIYSEELGITGLFTDRRQVYAFAPIKYSDVAGALAPTSCGPTSAAVALLDSTVQRSGGDPCPPTVRVAAGLADGEGVGVAGDGEAAENDGAAAAGGIAGPCAPPAAASFGSPTIAGTGQDFRS